MPGPKTLPSLFASRAGRAQGAPPIGRRLRTCPTLDSREARAFVPQPFRRFAVLSFLRRLVGLALVEIGAAGTRDVIRGCEVDDRPGSFLGRYCEPFGDTDQAR